MIKKVIFVLACMTGVLNGFAQKPSDTPVSQMEKLDRGAVLIKRPGTSTNSYYLSWRLLGTDDTNTTFQILRDGQPYANGKVYTNTTSANVTCSASQKIQLVTLKNGVEVERTEAITPWTKPYLEIPLEKPANGALGGVYSPNDCSVGDVDGDGCDEIIWGSGAVDNDGSMLYSVGFGHGDAIHLADLDPDRPGYEVFDVHEEEEASFGADLHDAKTGEVLVRKTSDRDTGRGLAADYDSDYRGAEFTYATQTSTYKINGIAAYSSNPGMNFRIYWDGDEYEETLDDVTITKWTKQAPTIMGLGFSRNSLSAYGSPVSCNGTKATPCLQADLFGDWREEVIFWNNTDSASINIYSSAYTTNYRVPTLMHDHMYRIGVAWQNVAYNQPPHLGYYLPDYIDSFQGVATAIQSVETDAVKDDAWYTLQGVRVDKPTTKGVYIHKGMKVVVE